MVLGFFPYSPRKEGILPFSYYGNIQFYHKFKDLSSTWTDFLRLKIIFVNNAQNPNQNARFFCVVNKTPYFSEKTVESRY